MSQHMLDTNMVSHFIKEHPVVVKRMVEVPITSLCISSITAGELLFGLAKRPTAKRLHTAVTEFLHHVEVCPWNNATAERYGIVRAEMQRQGKILSSLDLLIAAHALEVGAVLVTNDRAFSQIAGLRIEDWTDEN